ncbi:unnamed protein product [Cochlearia groenlandica]
METIKNPPTPTTITEVRSFHSMASFYQRFVHYFNNITSPLTDCMKGAILSQRGLPIAFLVRYRMVLIKGNVQIILCMRSSSFVMCSCVQLAFTDNQRVTWREPIWTRSYTEVSCILLLLANHATRCAQGLEVSESLLAYIVAFDAYKFGYEFGISSTI